MSMVAITGANGFIGSRLVRRFREDGWRVLALVRDPSGISEPGVEVVRYDLRGDLAPAALAGVDVLVHAAIVKEDEAANVEGTRRLLTAAQEAGVGRRIFISSVSAREDALSGYGRQKLAAELLFDGSGDAVIRAGLVVGAGGLVGDTVSFLRRFHLLPLIDGGRQPVQTVSVDDLTTAIKRLADPRSELRGVFTVADPLVRTMRDAYETIAAALGIRVVVVPVPFWIPLLVARAVKRLPLRLPINEDNLRGLRQARPSKSADDLRRLGLQLEPLEDVARRLR